MQGNSWILYTDFLPNFSKFSEVQVLYLYPIFFSIIQILFEQAIFLTNQLQFTKDIFKTMGRLLLCNFRQSRSKHSAELTKVISIF